MVVIGIEEESSVWGLSGRPGRVLFSRRTQPNIRSCRSIVDLRPSSADVFEKSPVRIAASRHMETAGVLFESGRLWTSVANLVLAL